MLTDDDKTIVDTIRQLISLSSDARRVIMSASPNPPTRQACGFLAKQAMHANTILGIVDQKKNFSGEIQYDHSSLYCLVRVMLELDLIMYDLLIANDSAEELHHKLDMWYLHTWTSQRYALGSHPSAESRIQELNVQINEMVMKLRASSYFIALAEPNKKKVDDFLDLAVQGKRFKPKFDRNRLGIEAGYTRSTADIMYTYTSAYVHSTGYGLMQILTPNDRDPFAMCRAGIMFTRIILAMTFRRFSTVSGYELSPEIQQFLVAVQDLAKMV